MRFLPKTEEKLQIARDNLRIALHGVHTRDDVEHAQAVQEMTTDAVRLILDVLLDQPFEPRNTPDYIMREPSRSGQQRTE